MTGREKARYVVYMMVGAYLLYLAYLMYKELDSSENQTLSLVFLIIFAIFGVGLLIFGGWFSYKVYRKSYEDFRNGTGAAQEDDGEASAEETAEEAVDKSDPEPIETDESEIGSGTD